MKLAKGLSRCATRTAIDASDRRKKNASEPQNVVRLWMSLVMIQRVMVTFLHSTSKPSSASSIRAKHARALFTVSAYSCSGMESATMPHPLVVCFSVCMTMVRIASKNLDCRRSQYKNRNRIDSTSIGQSRIISSPGSSAPGDRARRKHEPSASNRSRPSRSRARKLEKDVAHEK